MHGTNKVKAGKHFCFYKKRNYPEAAQRLDRSEVTAPGAKPLLRIIVTSHCSETSESHSWIIQGCGPIELLGFEVFGLVDIHQIANAVKNQL